MSGGANTPGGMNPSPTGGTLTGFDVKLRRGQDPSLRCKRHMGGNGKVAGRACPAPTDCCFRNRGFGGAWRRTTSAASLLRKHARAVVCPAGANIARSPVSLRSTVAPCSQPRNVRPCTYPQTPANGTLPGRACPAPTAGHTGDRTTIFYQWRTIHETIRHWN